MELKSLPWGGLQLVGTTAAATRKQRQTGVRRRKGDLGEYSGELLEKQEEWWSKWTGWAFVTSHTGPRIFLDDFLFNNEDNKKYLTFTIFAL